MYKTKFVQGFKIYSSINDPLDPIIYIFRGGSYHFSQWTQEKIKKSLDYWNDNGFSAIAFDYPDYDEYSGRENEVIVNIICRLNQFGSQAK